MTNRNTLLPKLARPAGAAALAAFLVVQAAAQEADILLRCTTGPGQLSEPFISDLPARDALLLRVSGGEWQEWSPQESRWSVDLCARRQTTCHVTPLRLVRIANFFDGEQTVSLERAIDRRTGAYRMRITTSGPSHQVVQWDGACEAVGGV